MCKPGQRFTEAQRLLIQKESCSSVGLQLNGESRTFKDGRKAHTKKKSLCRLGKCFNIHAPFALLAVLSVLIDFPEI